ncbi:MAG: 3-isopropylmalate dehydratase small subunit [Arachnia sp.]
MDAFTTHTGVGVPLRRSNVDTDQIIPAVYLKRITRTGFEDGLFSAWRGDPEFVLNTEPYTRGTVLLPGPDFGTGSSREHAVWALQNYGFRVVLGTRFGDIFRSNAGKAGLLVGVVTPDVMQELWQAVETEPANELTVDLASRTVTVGERSFDFEIDDYTQHRLLNGLDDISSTLQHADEIAAYETTRPGFKPKTLPAKTAD